jgi:hypothetical protein
MSWILTLTGKRFELLEPTAAMIDPMDIAHSLAHQCPSTATPEAFTRWPSTAASSRI